MKHNRPGSPGRDNGGGVTLQFREVFERFTHLRQCVFPGAAILETRIGLKSTIESQSYQTPDFRDVRRVERFLIYLHVGLT